MPSNVPLRLPQLVPTVAGTSAGAAWLAAPPREWVTSGSPALDQLTGGLPRGALTEISAPASAGRTSWLLSCLEALTGAGESCAYLDAQDAFDVVGAEAAGVRLDHLLWLGGGGELERTWRAADLVLQAGGFGVVVLDLGDVTARELQRWPVSTWYRFRAAVARTPTVLLVLGPEGITQSCAALRLAVARDGAHWIGTGLQRRVLERLDFRLTVSKPVQGETGPQRARLWA